MIDFNYAESQNSFDLIPANTIAKARLVLKAGTTKRIILLLAAKIVIPLT